MANDQTPSQDPRPPRISDAAPAVETSRLPAGHPADPSRGEHEALRARLATAGARAALEVEQVMIGLAKFPSP